MEGAVLFVEVQFQSEPSVILPAIASSDGGLDTGDLAAVRFIQIVRTK